MAGFSRSPLAPHLAPYSDSDSSQYRLSGDIGTERETPAGSMFAGISCAPRAHRRANLHSLAFLDCWALVVLLRIPPLSVSLDTERRTSIFTQVLHALGWRMRRKAFLAKLARPPLERGVCNVQRWTDRNSVLQFAQPFEGQSSSSAEHGARNERRVTTGDITVSWGLVGSVPPGYAVPDCEPAAILAKIGQALGSSALGSRTHSLSPGTGKDQRCAQTLRGGFDTFFGSSSVRSDFRVPPWWRVRRLHSEKRAPKRGFASTTGTVSLARWSDARGPEACLTHTAYRAMTAHGTFADAPAARGGSLMLRCQLPEWQTMSFSTVGEDQPEAGKRDGPKDPQSWALDCQRMGDSLPQPKRGLAPFPLPGVWRSQLGPPTASRDSLDHG